jgi:hypothetical protein
MRSIVSLSLLVCLSVFAFPSLTAQANEGFGYSFLEEAAGPTASHRQARRQAQGVCNRNSYRDCAGRRPGVKCNLYPGTYGECRYNRYSSSRSPTCHCN